MSAALALLGVAAPALKLPGAPLYIVPMALDGFCRVRAMFRPHGVAVVPIGSYARVAQIVRAGAIPTAAAPVVPTTPHDMSDRVFQLDPTVETGASTLSAGRGTPG